MLFKLHHVSKTYQHQGVLSDISLGMNAGEIVALLGESGSGKSTLLRIAAGLLDTDEGFVTIDNQRFPAASDQLIPGYADVKIVHQDYQLSLPLTVRENITYALRFYEKAYRDERTQQLIELCHLETVAEHPAKWLSGGEKQRTAIARALAEEARILLLDEPFAHLDLPNRRRLRDTIRELVEEMNVACMFVTHDATDALSLSHRMGVLWQGQLVQIGTPEEVYQRPFNTYVAALAGETNLLSKSFYDKYLQKSIGYLMSDGWVLVRPESFTVVEGLSANMPEIVVTQCTFVGDKYRIESRLAEQVLIFYCPRALSKGQVVTIQQFQSDVASIK